MIDYPIDKDGTQSIVQTVAANIAIDVAHQMTCQAINTAQDAISYGDEAKPLVVQLAAANIQAAAIVYAAHTITDAMREVTPEIAGAISENGTDRGAGIALAIEQILKTFLDDNTHND